MAFTYNRTDFVNLRDYNEVEHANALKGIFPTVVTSGFQYSESSHNITNGTANNNGLPVTIGKVGETQDITANYTGYILIKTILTGLASESTIIQSTTNLEITSTATTRYFALYQLANGAIFEDMRFLKLAGILDGLTKGEADGYYLAVDGSNKMETPLKFNDNTALNAASGEAYVNSIKLEKYVTPQIRSVLLSNGSTLTLTSGTSLVNYNRMVFKMENLSIVFTVDLKGLYQINTSFPKSFFYNAVYPSGTSYKVVAGTGEIISNTSLKFTDNSKFSGNGTDDGVNSRIEKVVFL